MFALGGLILVFDWTVAAGQTPEPTPTRDRLATPVLPPSPQPADYGRQVYYLNCMPCHGDVGQGLTDEWRDVWEEDHRDCWASGCHGGRAGDEGFPVPRTVPAVIGAPPILGEFKTIAELYDYLRSTHPPQRPGALSEADYHNVTALLWEASGRSTPKSHQPAPNPALPIGFGLLVIVLIVRFAIKRRGRSAA
ncbi:MAG: hypothetical protein HY870_02665 [Chloroflexi bacterium]|nr:hypothetical protein [Chloroflexota bacterium]